MLSIVNGKILLVDISLLPIHLIRTKHSPLYQDSTERSCQEEAHRMTIPITPVKNVMFSLDALLVPEMIEYYSPVGLYHCNLVKLSLDWPRAKKATNLKFGNP